MMFRSLLFVPGDRPDRFPKAMASAADALILDLEDSVAPSKKDDARKAVAEFLKGERAKPVFVRVNPITSDMAKADVAAVIDARPDGIVLPKSESAADIETLLSLMGDATVPVLPIATETPRAVFGLGSYMDVSSHLVGLTWGAEDLPASIGASTSREPGGALTAPFEYVRSATLFAAHAAGVAAVETVFPDIKNLDGLAAYAALGRRDGFTAMMAIHPSQCDVINAAFTPTDAEVAHARMIVEAFEQNPDAGVLQIDGKMIDAPHVIQARKVLARARG